MSDEQTTIIEAPSATVEVTVQAKEPVAAHFHEMTSRLRLFYPEHMARADDPHYALFEKSKRLLEAQGKFVCWRCGRDEEASGHPIELHHTHVEQALINALDLQKVIAKAPEWNVDTEEELIAYLESPGNLTALCVDCHRGAQSIHLIPYPLWEAGRYEREDLPPIVTIESKTE